MPLGIMSNDEFELERQNSDLSYEPLPVKEKDEFINSNISRNDLPNQPRVSIEPDEDINTNAIITSEILSINRPGRDKAVPNIPDSLRKILGEEVAINGLDSARQLAKSLLGNENSISQPTLNSLGNGEVSRGTTNTELLNHINSRKTKISKKAINKINLAMSLMDEDKLQECNAVQLTTVMTGMSQVVKNMEPTSKEDENSKHQPVQFHFYAPQVKNESHYEIVTAKDNF